MYQSDAVDVRQQKNVVAWESSPEPSEPSGGRGDIPPPPPPPNFGDPRKFALIFPLKSTENSLGLKNLVLNIQLLNCYSPLPPPWIFRPSYVPDYYSHHPSGTKDHIEWATKW